MLLLLIIIEFFVGEIHVLHVFNFGFISILFPFSFLRLMYTHGISRFSFKCLKLPNYRTKKRQNGEKSLCIVKKKPQTRRECLNVFNVSIPREIFTANPKNMKNCRKSENARAFPQMIY